MADANRIAAALRYQQGMALPTPEPDSMVGRALDAAAQWGRGVQKNVSDLVSPTAWAEALKNPPRGVLSQMNPENKQEMINQGIDNALNFGPAMLGKIVYHGSPHKFDAFDMSKIGTGEGAQAYGHGLYFAEAPEVAKSYQPKAAWQVINKQNDSPQQFLAMVLDSAQKPVGKKAFATSKEAEDYAQDLAYKYNNGSFYKVDLPDEQIAKMLDWDKPLSEQAPEVQAAIAQLHGKDALGRPTNAPPLNPEDRGQWLYQALQEGRTQKLTSEALRQAGIPGIRYLDQGSRAGGQGTSNYVVFEDQIPKIIGRE